MLSTLAPGNIPTIFINVAATDSNHPETAGNGTLTAGAKHSLH
jgi:hypothetical protein